MPSGFPRFPGEETLRNYAFSIEAYSLTIRLQVLKALEDDEKAVAAAMDEEYGVGDWDEDELHDFMESLSDGAYTPVSLIRAQIANLGVVGLYHMLEHQLVDAPTQIFFPYTKKKPGAQLSGEKPVDAFLQFAARSAPPFDPNGIRSAASLDELRLMANAIKHGEGPSFEKLKAAHPHRIDSPIVDGFGRTILPSELIPMPLMTNQITVTPDLIDDYGKRVVAFWDEVANALFLQHQRP